MRSGELLQSLTSTVIHGYGSCLTHDHVLLSHDPKSCICYGGSGFEGSYAVLAVGGECWMQL